MSLYEAFDSGEKGRTVVEFEKMRFELAWRHFDLHAKQRTQMFHFFIILTPFLFGGCFLLFKEREIIGWLPPIIASIGGSFLALLFLFLDQRNKQLYRVSQDALVLLENQIFFTDFRPLREVSGANYPGVISKEKELYGDHHWLKHTTLMGFVYGTAIGLFFCLALYFLAVRLGCIKLPLPSTISTFVSGSGR
jgi:uncharacterized membrane protein YbhN (UPF0104 family)